MQLTLEILPWDLSILQLPVGDPYPTWIEGSAFKALTITPEEYSIVCESAVVPQEVDATSGWSCLRVVGPLEFEATGIMAELIAPLAEAEISIFAISTFHTDYILLRSDSLDEAVTLLGERYPIVGA